MNEMLCTEKCLLIFFLVSACNCSTALFSRCICCSRAEAGTKMALAAVPGTRQGSTSSTQCRETRGIVTTLHIMSTDRSTQHSASQNGENGGGWWWWNALFCSESGGSEQLTGAWYCMLHGRVGGGGRVQQLGAASQQCHDLITRCNEWNQPLVRTTTNTFSCRHFILNLIVSFDSGRWWHNCEIAGWEPEDESWAAILQPLSSIYQDPGPEPDIIRFTLHPPSPDYHHHPPTQRWRRRRFVALISDFLWWMLNHARSGSVQSQFMLKSSTQIMFKQMQTKFVGKPLLHFPQNLIKTLKID